MTARGSKRDVTKALELVGEMHKRRRQHRGIGGLLDALTTLLIRMDARTGRRDPSTRVPKSGKPIPIRPKAKRSARQVRG